jgi:hypothetical protein
VVFGRNFLPLPVSAKRAGVVDLEAVHSDVAFAGFGVAGNDTRKSDEASGILGPALQDGEVEKGEIIVLDDLFAGAGGDGLGEKLSGFGEKGKHFEFVEEALRRFEVHEDADAVGEFVEGVDAERELHSGIGAELVDENLRAGMVFNVLEEKGGATEFSSSRLAYAVGYFRDFQNGIDFGLDAFELAGAVKSGNPLAEVIEGQR